MSQQNKKERVLELRMRGMSYSQIKNKIKISKSTLSTWLREYPLSNERIKELRDHSAQRIENCRNTKLKKRQEKLDGIYKTVSREIGVLSNRDLFIAGLFLYWGEGTKTARDIVAFTNTDPLMIKFFINWMELLGVPKDKIKIKLHLYADMDIKEKTKFWIKTLNIPEHNFRKPYVKESKFAHLTYKNSFGHGTCSVIFGSTVLHHKILMSLKYLRQVV